MPEAICPKQNIRGTDRSQKTYLKTGNSTEMRYRLPVNEMTKKTCPNYILLLFVLMFLFASCNKDTGEENVDETGKQSSNQVSGSIHVLIVDDPQLGAIVQRQWQARTDSELEYTNVDVETFQQQKSTLIEECDIVIYPTRMLAELAREEHLAPISDGILNSKLFDRRSIFGLERGAVVSWGKKVWGVSLGSPRPGMIYDADRLQALKIQAPVDRQQFDDVIERLMSIEGEESVAVVEPTAGHWASYSLLTRVADYTVMPGKYSTLFDIDSMDALVNTPPFVRALNEMKAAWQTRKSDGEHLTPQQVLERIVTGRAVIAITWPHAAGAKPDFENQDFQKLRVSQFPVATQSFDSYSNRWENRPVDSRVFVPVVGHTGFVGSHSAYTKKTGLANHFLSWLASKKISQEISPYSKESTMTRPNQVALTYLWIGDHWPAEVQDQYGQVVAKDNNQVVWLGALRIPGQSRYLDALDKAVRDVLDGNATPEDALNGAATQWNAITDDLDREQQKSAVRREMGISN